MILSCRFHAWWAICGHTSPSHAFLPRTLKSVCGTAYIIRSLSPVDGYEAALTKELTGLEHDMDGLHGSNRLVRYRWTHTETRKSCWMTYYYSFWELWVCHCHSHQKTVGCINGSIISAVELCVGMAGFLPASDWGSCLKREKRNRFIWISETRAFCLSCFSIIYPMRHWCSFVTIQPFQRMRQ